MKNFDWTMPRMGAVVLAAALGGGALTACVPLMVGGAVLGGTLVATDRRTSGAQLEDEGLELRGVNRIREAMGDRARVTVTSYNRQVLLTGEVPTEADKLLAEQIVSRLDNAQKVVNELAVMPNNTLTQRSADALITGKVKASFVDAKDIFANAFKVVTDRGITYLMGRVTQREADRATEIVRGIYGVQKVVRILDILTEEDLQRVMPQQAAKP
jgi:osmotically-inducible protein OsmY